MRILFLNTYYEAFLKRFYETHDVKHLEYMEHWDEMQHERFGDSDFYSHAFYEMDWQAHDLIANDERLQNKWAREHGIKSGLPIFVEQIRYYKPDVVYSQGLWLINDDTYPLIKDFARLIVGQVGSHLDNFSSDYYDIIFTSHPLYPERFAAAAVESHYLPLAFDPRVLHEIGEYDRIYPITFVGQLTAGHRRRREIVDALSKHYPVERFESKLWGQDYFRMLARSRITINHSHDFIYPFGGNMRLFEATGMGALMLTERFQNLSDFFEEDEVVAYSDADEAVERVGYYLEHWDEGIDVALRGQQRTLREHTYEERMKTVVEILETKL